jgi:hypothetical protein
VVNSAPEGYFSLYKTKTSGAPNGRFMEADSATRSRTRGRTP